MPAFQGTPHSSSAASALLHPSATWAEQGQVDPEVLGHIASGLSSAVDPDTMPAGRTVLLATVAYEVTVERIAPDSSMVAGGSQGQPAAFAVVRGELLVWTASDGTHSLGPGSSCSLAAHERVQAVNLGSEPVVVVTARGLAGMVAERGPGVFRPHRSLVN